MAEDEMFDSAVRSAGDRAGVFEHDGDSGYFYLCETKGQQTKKVTGSIRVVAGTPDFTQEDIEIRWDSTESKVGLFIRRQLWAVFDCETGANFGGDYRPSTQARIPVEIISAFQ